MDEALRIAEALVFASEKPVTRDQLARLLRDQKGANAIEYALIAGLIATAAVFAMSNLGSGVNNLYGNVSSKLG